MRLRLDLCYLGTRFEGWQAQQAERAGATPRTVQGEVEAALARIYGRDLRAAGAGRTDSGVHAEGQVAHVDVPDDAARIPPEGLTRALNGALPEDVRVLSVSVAPEDWHARFSAVGKVYLYRLRRGAFLHPHRGLVESLARETLDVSAMRAAAAGLLGRRDFAPFSITGSHVTSTVRTLSRLDVEEDGDLILVTALGDGFLRGMVRRLVGTLRDAGRGRITPGEALVKPGPTAEARGLTLQKVLYPPERLPDPPSSSG